MESERPMTYMQACDDDAEGPLLALLSNPEPHTHKLIPVSPS